MIKNIIVKNLLSKTVFQVLSTVNQIIPKNDKVILLYSNMGFRDNIQALYEFLIENKYNDEYQIIISTSGELPIVPKNVEVINNIKGVFKYFISGHVFYAFGKIPIFPSRKQCVIQMWHGTPFKAPDQAQLKSITYKPYYSKLLISSLFFSNIVKNAHGLKDQNIAVCGQPRTDVMFKHFEKYQMLEQFSKVIIWMPTFRNSTILGYSDIKEIQFQIPIFNINEYKELDEYLQSLKMCLIVKLHPMEDTKMLCNQNYKNLYIMSDEEFNKKDWELYKLLAQCNALITDYSSVFYDFMLLNRPLAFTVDDINQYKEQRGFAVPDPDYLTAGYKLRDKTQFYRFLNDVSINKDSYRRKREEVNKLVNTYNDGKQCLRAIHISNIYKEGEKNE